MNLCSNLGFSKVIFEGDCQEIVKATNNHLDSWAEVSPLIHDIKSMLKNRFGWKVSFNYRETNSAAHNLAKIAVSFPEEHIWMEECPTQIMNVDLKEKFCND